MASLDRDSIRHIVLQLKLQRAVHCMRLLGPDFREEMDQTVTRLHLPPGKLASACPEAVQGMSSHVSSISDRSSYRQGGRRTSALESWLGFCKSCQPWWMCRWDHLRPDSLATP